MNGQWANLPGQSHQEGIGMSSQGGPPIWWPAGVSYYATQSSGEWHHTAD